MTNFLDKAEIGATKTRADGTLLADVQVARTGIQEYLAIEMGLTDRNPLDVVKVYRPPEEVFADNAMASFAHRPVTNEHPFEMVTSDNWKRYAVGSTSGGVEEMGGKFLRVPLMVSDKDAIADIQNGKRELSAGYTADIEWVEGKTPEGETYDAIQKNIRANHVAIVQHGRAGSECRIGDNAHTWGASPYSTKDGKDNLMDLKTITVDGMPLQVSDQAAAVIDKLQKEASTAQIALDTAKSEHDAKVAEMQSTIDTKDAEIDGLKEKILSDDDMSKMVSDTMAVLSDAKTLVDDDFKFSDLTPNGIRRAVVVDHMGDNAKDKSQDYIDARFDGMLDAAKQTGGDPARQAMLDGKTTTPAGDNGRQAYIDRKTNAWKGNK